MSAMDARQSLMTSPLMSVAVHCLVVPLPCATGDDGQPMRPLPRGRLTTAILPIVGSPTRATGGGDDLGGGVVGERFSEGHGQTVSRKKKSAMPKIILAISRHCRQIAHMSNTKHRFTKVSEYIAAGAMEVGFVLESPTRETEKALGFKGVKFSSYGNAYNAVIWLPKSQLQKLENDFYTNDAPAVMWFCPSWLYAKNPTLGEVAP